MSRSIKPIVNPAAPPLLAFALRYPLLICLTTATTVSIAVANLYRPGVVQFVVQCVTYVALVVGLDRFRGLPWMISTPPRGYTGYAAKVADYAGALRSFVRRAPRHRRRELRAAAAAAVWDVASDARVTGSWNTPDARAALHAPWCAIAAACAGLTDAEARLADELGGDVDDCAATVHAATGADVDRVRRYVELAASGEFADDLQRSPQWA